MTSEAHTARSTDEGMDDMAKAVVKVLERVFQKGSSSSSCASVLLITGSLTSPEYILKVRMYAQDT